MGSSLPGLKNAFCHDEERSAQVLPDFTENPYGVLLTDAPTLDS